MLASVIANISGKALKQPVTESVFLPHYLEAGGKSKPPRDPQQKAEFAAFRVALDDANARAKGNKS